MLRFNHKIYKEERIISIMRSRRIKHVVISCMFLFLLSFVSAGNVIVRNGNITTADTITGQFISEASASGDWHLYNALGLLIGKFTVANTAFQMLPSNGVNAWVGNSSTAVFVADNINKYATAYGVNGFYTEDISGPRTFQTNRTRTTIYGNSSIKGTYNDWAVNNGVINATGVTIISSHPSTLNTTKALDTTYTHTNSRAAIIKANLALANLFGTSGDATGVDFYVNGVACDSAAILELSGTSPGVIDTETIFCTVQPGQKWSLNTTVIGTGFATLNRIEETYL